MFTFIAFHRQVRHVCNVYDPVYVQNKIILLASRLNSVLTITEGEGYLKYSVLLIPPKKTSPCFIYDSQK